MRLAPADPRAGSNLKGAAAGAGWTYILDRLDPDRVLCVGQPPGATLGTLNRIASDVMVMERQNVNELPIETFDLVYVSASGRAALEKLETCTSIARSLTSGGQLFVEDRRSGALAKVLRDAGLSPVEIFWLTPARGEMRSAVPLNDQDIRAFFVNRSLTVPSWPPPLRVLDRLLPIAASANRIGILATRFGSGEAQAARVPAYVRDVASARGVDLSSFRFGLSARGRYNSRKVVLYLFAPGARQPELIVKATRDATQNGRLENEERALRRVAELGLVDAGTAPAVVFSGEHGGLKILAETALEGRLLSSAAGASGVSHAYGWLTDLSAASARRDEQATAQTLSLLESVGSSVLRIYPLDHNTRDRLQRAIDAVAASADLLPGVFVHGDAATWNAMLRTDGRVAFLDWEAAAGQGMPLWDLFYFARSHVLDRAKLRRHARRPANLVRTLLADPDFRKAVESYCHRLEIPTELVAPLFSLCWAYRAVREVTRLKVEQLSKGHYFRLLKASLNVDPSAHWQQRPRTK